MDTKRITIKTRPIPRRTLGYYVKGPLLADKVHYWPAESLLFAYALACLEVVLKLSGAAQKLWLQIVEAWELPGCQDILNEAIQHNSETQAILKCLVKAIENHQPKPEWATPSIIADRHQDNADFQTYIDKIRELVLVGFNRRIDLDNERPKVIPNKAPNLVTAIVVRSLVDHFRYTEQFDLARLTQYAPGVDSIMAKAHPPRREQRIKHAIICGYQHWKSKLRHDTKLLKDAAHWYKCRVNPGTIELHRDELAKGGKYLERSNIGNAIAPCDEALRYAGR